MNTLLTVLFSCWGFFIFSQNTTPIDLNVKESKCDCLKSTYLIKKELLENYTINDGRIVFDSKIIEKHNITLLELHEIEKKCDHLSNEKSCVHESKLLEFDEEFKLILRVYQINSQPHGDF